MDYDRKYRRCSVLLGGWHRADAGLCRDHGAWQPTCIDRGVIVRGTGGAHHFLAIAPQRKKISMKPDILGVKAV